MLTTTQLAQKIDDWVFCAKNRELLKAKLIDGATFEQLAQMTEMSVNGVKHRYASALADFKRAMTDDGHPPDDYLPSKTKAGT